MKKTFKRILSIMMVVVMTIGIAPLSGFVGLELPEFGGFKKLADSLPEFFDGFSTKAEAATRSGNCGENLTWTLNTDTSVLTINGSGEMYNYSSGKAPWGRGIVSLHVGIGVTSICNYAFKDCSNLSIISLPPTLKDIGTSAFESCSELNSISIPSSVESIGSHAFENTAYYNNNSNWDGLVLYIDNCLIKAKYELKGEYNIKEGTRVVAESAFHGCDEIESLRFPDSIKMLSANVASFCNNLNDVYIPESVTFIGVGALGSCPNLKEVIIPPSVKYIDGAAFSDSGLTSIIIPSGVTGIGSAAFRNCFNLKSVIFEKNSQISNIGSCAFEACPITRIEIPSNVVSIEEYAFENCYRLTEITVPSSVKQIGKFAFFGCDKLEDVYYSGTEAQWNEIIIGTANFELLDVNIHFNSYGDTGESPDDSEDENTDETKKLYLVSASPANNATAVSYDDSVVLTFNKNIKTYLLSGQSGTNTEIAIRSYTTDEPIFSTYDMNSETFPVESGNQLIIPFALLKMTPGEKYYVYISPNSIRAADNFSGEKFEGITNKDTYTFSNFTPSITEGYSLDLFSANGNIELKPEEEVSVAAVLSLNGEPCNTKEISFSISDTSVAEITKIDNQSDRIVAFIKGNQQGVTTLNVNAVNANRNISVPVFVNDNKTVYYPSDLYKFNENNPLITQGMFLTDFDFEENNSGGTCTKFDVYNADCCTGIVDVYDSKGICVESVLIDMFDGDYPTDIFDHLKYAGELVYNVFEIFDPDVKIQKAYTEKTSVSIDIPHNGYIIITKDVAASADLLVYDIVTLTLEAVSSACEVFEHLSSSEKKEVKKVITEKLLDKISSSWIAKFRNDFFEYSVQNKETDDFIQNLFSDIDSALAENGYDFISIIIDSAKSVVPGATFDVLKDYVLKDFGIDIVDKIFYKSVKAVKWATIFNFISVYLLDESLVVYASQDGETKYSNGAKAQLSENDEDVVFHSVMITCGEKSDVLNATLGTREVAELFEISLIKRGSKYDPGKPVTVYLPIPDGWDTENMTVYHLSDNYKTREKLDIVIENGYVKFITEDFSPFILANRELSFVDSVSIKTPSITTINYGDTLILHAEVANIPNDARIEWSAEGSIISISPSADEKTCAVTPQKSGSVTVTMKLVDANGNTLKNLAGEELISEQNLISKAGFFQKIIAFFKKLFGLTKTYPELFKSLF